MDEEQVRFYPKCPKCGSDAFLALGKTCLVQYDAKAYRIAGASRIGRIVLSDCDACGYYAPVKDWNREEQEQMKAHVGPKSRGMSVLRRIYL